MCSWGEREAARSRGIHMVKAGERLPLVQPAEPGKRGATCNVRWRITRIKSRLKSSKTRVGPSMAVVGGRQQAAAACRQVSAFLPGASEISCRSIFARPPPASRPRSLPPQILCPTPMPQTCTKILRPPMLPNPPNPRRKLLPLPRSKPSSSTSVPTTSRLAPSPCPAA
jgi:hypothetical protein